MSDANKKIVQAVNDAFTTNDTEAFLAHCKDDVVWTIVGELTNTSTASIREWMKSDPTCEPPKFTVDKIIAEGDSAMCYGDMLMKDEKGVEAKYSFVDAYEFDNGKIAELRSFIVKHKNEGETEKAAA